LKSARTAFNLSEYGLEGLAEGKPVVLYHGTTKLFKSFSMEKSRDELVNRFYGKGIFLSPSKRVAMRYADANRNIGFDVSIIDDLKRKNPNAGGMLQTLYEMGTDAWEAYPKATGFWNDNPPPGEGTFDSVGFGRFLGGVDPNTLNDISGYILGSKITPLSTDDGPINIFSQSTGAPDWLYAELDTVGLDSKTYRPKVYTVVVTVNNPLITKSKSQASKARSKGFDSVVYYGFDLVGGVPEVAVFNPRNVRVKSIEVV
jgi:hypothetical protein